MARCCALTDAKWRSQQHWRKQCENQATHIVEGVVLCGTHFNAGFRGTQEVIITLRILDDGDF